MTRIILAGACAITLSTAAHADKSAPPKPMTEQDLQVVIIDDTATSGNDDIIVPALTLLFFAAVRP